MTKLDCNVSNCYYNADKKCSKENILVEGAEASVPTETSCSSFRDQGCRCSASNSAKEPKYTLEVQCRAKNCTFNKNEVCSANHIGITGANACVTAETQCSSFEKK